MGIRTISLYILAVSGANMGIRTISPLHPHSVWSEHVYPDHIPSTSPQCLERTCVSGPYPLYIPTVSGANMCIRTISLYIPTVSGANMSIRTISPLHPHSVWSEHGYPDHIPSTSPQCLERTWVSGPYPSTSPQCLERTCVSGPYPLYIPTVSGANMGIRTISPLHPHSVWSEHEYPDHISLHPRSVWSEHGYPDHIPSTSPQCLERTWAHRGIIESIFMARYAQRLHGGAFVLATKGYYAFVVQGSR